MIPSLAAFHQLDRHLAAKGFDLCGATAADRIGAMSAREVRDTKIERAAPYGGAAAAGSSSGAGKSALECDTTPRLHVKALVKVLQLWLNSPDVAGPIVYAVAPVAAAFCVAWQICGSESSSATALLAVLTSSRSPTSREHDEPTPP